jgi:hypothetical protein
VCCCVCVVVVVVVVVVVREKNIILSMKCIKKNCIDEIFFHECRGRKRKRSCNRRCNRSFMLDEIDHLTELEFQEMFRMN